MTNGEKHIEKLLSWYKKAVTEDGVCYLTCDDKNTLAYAIKCCKHFEDIKKDIDTWMLREEPSSSEKPNKSEIPTSSVVKNDLPHCQYSDEEIAKSFIEDVEAVKDQLPCGEQMDFPDTFDEFAKDYGFKDKDEVYTNGLELIPVYRVKQWLEHITPIRPKGHWIWELDETPSTPISPYEVNYAGWVCSCCHKFPDDICEWDDPDEPPTYKFCPNCGADMRGEK